MTMNKFAAFLTLCVLCAEVQSAKILIIYQMPSPSHHILGETFARGLSAKGHEVTMLSPIQMKNNYTNCKHVLMEGIFEKMDKFKEIFLAKQKHRFFAQFTEFQFVVDVMTTAALESPAIQNLLQSKEKYDLVILDEFFNKAHYGLAHHLNASLIVSSSSVSGIANHITGNPAPFSFVPNMMTPFSDRMNFFERVLNSVSGVVAIIMLNFIILPRQEILYREYFENGPELQELINGVSLAFVNTHPSIESPRPYLPNMIPIGGFHVQEPKKLSKDLEDFVSDTDDGFIYCSLGSNVQSSDLPQATIEAFLKSFSKLPHKILWKWENETLANKPNNVKTGKWFSQQDILAHPNIKAFITHGGLLSITEAMIRGVPLIVIPFFGDQPANAGNAVASGYGIRVLPEELTEDTLSFALQEILTNSKYREEMKRRSAIIRDQPEKPFDRAIFWVEHILRHKGGRHLHSTAAEINIFQYLLLDVAAVISAILIISISGLYYGVKFCCSRRKLVQQSVKKQQ